MLTPITWAVLYSVRVSISTHLIFNSAKNESYLSISTNLNVYLLIVVELISYLTKILRCVD